MNGLSRFAVIAAALALLSGCIVAAPPPPPPAYAYAPAYGYYAPAYGYYAPAYPAPVVGLGVGACFGCGRFHRW
jgi:hypothetical protein